jgi:hypothetical protein
LPTDIASHLDLALGLRRALGDRKSGQAFFAHPHELDLINVDRAAWLNDLRADLPTFVPGDLFVCNALKPNGGIRPGGILPLRDQTVYTALVGTLSEKIRLALSWNGETVDFSYPISTRIHDPEWFANYFPLWRAFETESLNRINDWANPIIFADIAAYYECIDIALLLSDLRGLNCPPAVIELLSRCLNKWSQANVPGRSLPQGFSASNILARFYLDRVDRALRDRGISHLRFVDDIRIFCHSEHEAKRHYVELIVQLRKRGLAVQTAKSGIVERAEAVTRIEGFMPALQTILRDFVVSIADLFQASDPYFDLSRAERLLENDPNAAPIGLIHEAYRRFFLQHDAITVFDKTLFHFLIRRLGRVQDPFAFVHAVGLLRTQPQETLEILRYLSNISRVEQSDDLIVEYLDSVEAPYSHQFYQVLSWRAKQREIPCERYLHLVRSLLYERNIVPYLRSACREFIARFGTEADLDRLHDSLATTANDLERAELLCCLRAMEPSRRNAILARYIGAGPYTDRAVRLVRSGWEFGGRGRD